MDGEQARVADGFVGDDLMVWLWRLLGAATSRRRAAAAAGCGCGITAGWSGIAGSLLRYGSR